MSPYSVTKSLLVDGLTAPVRFAFSPLDPNLLYVAEKAGIVRLVDIRTGASDTVLDIRGQVNNAGDRGLQDVVLHPDFRHAGLDDVDADQALTWLLEAFELRYAAWRDCGFTAVRADWLVRAYRLGQDIQVRLDGETVTGRFAELDETGALVVETAAGTRHITAGDVYFDGAA